MDYTGALLRPTCTFGLVIKKKRHGLRYGESVGQFVHTRVLYIHSGQGKERGELDIQSEICEIQPFGSRINSEQQQQHILLLCDEWKAERVYRLPSMAIFG